MKADSNSIKIICILVKHFLLAVAAM